MSDLKSKAINLLLNRFFWLVMASSAIFTIGLQVGKAQRDGNISKVKQDISDIKEEISEINNFLQTENTSIDTVSVRSENIENQPKFLDTLSLTMGVSYKIKKSETVVDVVVDFESFIDKDSLNIKMFLSKKMENGKYNPIGGGGNKIMSQPNATHVNVIMIPHVLEKGTYKVTLIVEGYKKFYKIFIIT